MGLALGWLSLLEVPLHRDEDGAEELPQSIPAQLLRCFHHFEAAVDLQEGWSTSHCKT